MPALYLLTAPAPPFAGTDAVFNEVAALQAHLGGDSINLYPFPTRAIRVPRQLYGLHALPALRRAELYHDINHIYFPVLHWLPVLGLLRNPTVYTVTATLDRSKPPRHLAKLGELARIVVSNERDAEILTAWGLTNFDLIPPGVDTSGILRRALPLTGELRLLMASAPWHKRHFDLKGIDVLLEAAARLPYLKLILVWRGLLVEELTARIDRYGLGERVEVVSQKVDIDSCLARAHATVVLAKEGFVVKAYPHSLVESLLAGKPVLLSEKIPMADYVRQHGCGLIIEKVDPGALIDAVETFRRNYQEIASSTVKLPGDTFAVAKLIGRYRQVYARALARLPEL